MQVLTQFAIMSHGNITGNFIFQMIMEQDDEVEEKQELLQQLNQTVITLSFPPFNPKQQQMYNAGWAHILPTQFPQLSLEI